MTNWTPVDVVDAARCLIGASAADGELVDLQRLQHLCYYAQGRFLAFHAMPLFEAPILAGRDGPRIASVEAAFGDANNGPIPTDTGCEPTSLGILAGMTLSTTHHELPRDGEAGYIAEAHDQPLWACIPPGREIGHDSLRRHFVDAFEFGVPAEEREPYDREPLLYIEVDGRLLIRHPSRAGEPLPPLS